MFTQLRVSIFIIFMFQSLSAAAPYTNTVLVPECIDEIPEYFCNMYIALMTQDDSELPRDYPYYARSITLEKHEKKLFDTLSTLSSKLLKEDAWPKVTTSIREEERDCAGIKKCDVTKDVYSESHLKNSFVVIVQFLKKEWRYAEFLPLFQQYVYYKDVNANSDVYDLLLGCINYFNLSDDIVSLRQNKDDNSIKRFIISVKKDSLQRVQNILKLEL